MIAQCPPPAPESIRDWLALAVALAAVLVVLVAPFVQLRIATRDRQARSDDLTAQLEAQRLITERQVLASVRSSNRQAWINALRDDVATYLNLTHQMALLQGAVRGGDKAAITRLADVMFEAGKIYSAIQLRLNPDKDMHNELLNCLGNLSSAAQIALDQFDAARADAVKQAQEIFRFEWKRVSRGE
jgi:hypothetical protein